MNRFTQFAAGALLLLASAPVFANVGGGATIHNAASMTFDGGEVRASVNVSVLTVGSAPIITADPVEVFAGDQAVVNYEFVNTSNGSDTFDIQVSTNDTDVSAPSNLDINPASLTLGASITSDPSQPGTIFIPAGSEADLQAGDTIQVTLGGTDYRYTIDSVTPGTPASTSGTTTTPEVPTALELSPIGSAPAIVAGNVPVGTQIGEVGDVTASFDAGSPNTPGTGGNHEVVIEGSAAAPGPGGPGDVVTFTDTTGSVDVLSGEAELTKEVRNVTAGGSFASSGVDARPGDELEYRITATTIPGEDVTGAVLSDEVPRYTSYVADSTTLNGSPFGQPDGGAFPFAGSGAAINSPGGSAGEILDGEQAVVIFRVVVD